MTGVLHAAARRKMITFILASTARSLVHHAEVNKLLNDNLYGARPGRTAHDPVGLEEFVGEITRLSRKPCIKNTEDATACYDRIIPSLGHLASRTHGLHRSIALVQGKTLEEVKYHLKTKLGITEEYYQHCEFHNSEIRESITRATPLLNFLYQLPRRTPTQPPLL